MEIAADEEIHLDDFQYRKKTDEYICPNGKSLRSRRKRIIVNDVIYKRYIANREDCTHCPSKDRCIKGNLIKGRYLGVLMGTTPGNLIKEMAEKVDTDRGGIYHQRIAIGEPVFANIKYGKGLNCFTLRGNIKVNIQWVLYCIAKTNSNRDPFVKKTQKIHFTQRNLFLTMVF